MASNPLLTTDVGAGPHTKETYDARARPTGEPAAHGDPPVKTIPTYWPLLTLQLEKEPKLVLVELVAAFSSNTDPKGVMDSARPWPPDPRPELALANGR